MKLKDNCHCDNCKHSHILKIENLHVHYRSICALHNISFEAACGNSIALIGGNGSGKTTLMKALVGIVPLSQGAVIWKEQPITKNTYEIAYLPQKEDIDWSFPITVEGLIEMGRFPLLGSFQKYKKEDIVSVQNAIDILEINHLRKRQIGSLSGGQQQRAFIARALAQNAHVLLLDEPFTGLDQPTQNSLIEIIKLLTKEGKLVIASHHDLNTIESIFDKTLIIKKNLIAYGDSNQVLKENNLKQAF